MYVFTHATFISLYDFWNAYLDEFVMKFLFAF